MANAGEIEKLRAKIRDNTFAADENADSVQSQIEAYQAQNDTLLDTINSYELMNASITEATSAYQNWLNAQNAAQSGDMFDSSLEAMKKINDTLNDAESDSYGRIGNKDYKAAVDFIVPDSVDHEDTEAVNSYMQSISDLFTHDSDGNRNGLDIQAFCQKAVDAGLMTLDESTEEYKIAGQQTMQEFADGLGLSLPLVQAMFGEMEEFGAEFNWADEANKTIGDLGVSATEAAEKLRSIDQFKDLKIQMDVSDLATSEEKISALDATSESIVKPSENAIVTHIAKGDSVLTADATRNIWDMASDPSDFISKNLFSNGVRSDVKPRVYVDNRKIGEVEFNLPNVLNYEDFMRRMQRDNKFEGMIQDMTIGIVAGKSSLAKNKYRW